MAWRPACKRNVFAVCLFALSSAADAQTATEITESIQQRFGNDRDYRNIDVSSSGAVVTLAGEAPSLYARAQAIQIARRTGGVDAVINDMAISGAESDQSIAEAPDDPGARRTTGTRRIASAVLAPRSRDPGVLARPKPGRKRQ